MKNFAALLLLAAVLLVLIPALAAQNSSVDIYGRPLPADAAPYEMQVWQVLCDASRTEIGLMSVVTVTRRICDLNGADKLSDSLVTLDENLNLVPAAAESWEILEDGLTWRFHLRPAQVWSDGTPLTATDYLATFRYMVNPATDYDSVSLWSGVIGGWDEASAGTIPPDQIGVTAVDDLTLDITTVAPVSGFPALHFVAPLQAAALAQYGSARYTLDPATSVSSGPFILTEYTPGVRLILNANPTYNGYRKPFLREIRGIYGNWLGGSLLAFQNHDVETAENIAFTPQDVVRIDADSALQAQFRASAGNFHTDLLFFNTVRAPFDDLNVRLAFAKAIDRETIISKTSAGFTAAPATSLLTPGFTSSDQTLTGIQAYDCPAAQALLTEAGYRSGSGFTPLELRLRAEPEAVFNRFLAAATSITNCLNIPISVINLPAERFMSDMLARPTALQFGGLSDDAAYPDPASLFNHWQSSGQYTWNNPDYDELITQAAGEPDAERRVQLYGDADRILVEDVGAVFVSRSVQGALFQSYVAGQCFTPDTQGISAWHWGNDGCWGSVYITDAAETVDTYRTRS
ncbi:MAG: peptide ABC transporter substrate-binding protein [Chloroflexota bacterium]